MKKVVSLLMASIMFLSLTGVLPSSAYSGYIIGDVGIPVEGYVCTYYEDSSGWQKYTYDSKGNEIYKEDNKGNSEYHKYTYYSNGEKKTEYYETSKGFWVKTKYDAQGNIILEKDSDGSLETWKYTYYTNGKIKTLHYKNNYNEWLESIYDENENEIYSNGYFAESEENGWKKYRYDSHGNKIYSEYESGYISTTDYTYYDNGNVKTAFTKDNYDYRCKSYYNEQGNITYQVELDDFWEKYFYDDKGNMTYFEDCIGNWEKFSYNSKGYAIYNASKEQDSIFWIKATYDSHGNMTKAKGDHKFWAKAKYAKAGSKKTIKPISSIRTAKAVAKDKKSANKAMQNSKIKKIYVKSKSKNIQASWDNLKKAWGYKVEVSKDKNFKKTIFKKNLKTNSLNINSKKIKKNKTYYLKVRSYASYRTKKGKEVKIFSKLSTIKKIKVK